MGFNIPKDNIFVLDNVLSLQACQEIMDLIDKYALKKDVLRPGNNVQCNTCSITSIEEKDPDTYKKYDKIIFDTIGRIVRYLNKCGITQINGDSGYELRKIYGPTREHTDGCGFDFIQDKNVPKNIVRLASVVIALNSDYDDGEFIFPRQDVKIKLKAGQAIVFPPYWTHPHKTGELNGTYRYTINTWLTH